MFIRLLILSLFCINAVAGQSSVANSSKGQSSTPPIFPKQDSLNEYYDLIDTKIDTEGSGAAATFDDYADEEEDDQLAKITTTTRITIIRSTSTTTLKLPEEKNKNDKQIITADLDADEFSEDYKEDLEDAIDYNELTTMPTSTTRPSPTVQRRTPLRVLFSFLTRPPIAAGILAGLAIGILTSVVLLICIVQRFHKRQRSHSSYTTGLLHPNQYGYSKSPQEFYA